MNMFIPFVMPAVLIIWKLEECASFLNVGLPFGENWKIEKKKMLTACLNSRISLGKF